MFTQETFVFDYALSGRSIALDAFEEATQVATLAYADLRLATLPYPNLGEALEKVHLLSTEWREEWAEPYLRSVGTGAALSNQIAVQASERLFLPAEKALDELKAALADRRQRTEAEISSAVPDLALVIVPFGVLMTLLLASIGA